MRRFLRKLHLWLIAHGIEFEYGRTGYATAKVDRHILIAINHRFFGVDITLDLYRGEFDDELDKSHAEVAASRARLGEKYGGAE